MFFLYRLLFYSTPVAAMGGGPGGAADAFLMEDGVSGILMEDGTSYFLMEVASSSTAGEALGLLLTITKAS